MKERPILFSAPMVRAILDGTKSQTRRVVEVQPNVTHDGEPYWHIGGYRAWEFRGITDPLRAGTHNPIRCKFGQPGERLWVRETFFAFGRWVTQFNPKKGRDEWHFIDMTLETGKAYGYPGDFIPHDFTKGNQRNSVTPTWWKRPSLFMPRWASRIDLLIKSVRVERLQDISEDDAIAEGAPWAACGSPQDGSHKAGYAQLWESINGHGSWDANPWVWVIEFERVGK